MTDYEKIAYVWNEPKAPIDVHNAPMIRTFQRVGYTQEGEPYRVEP